MPRNGSGTYSLPVGNPVVTGTTISSTWANNTLTDISNALTGSLSADGQTTASGNLNMGTNRIINLADPQNAQDGATKYYVDQLIAALGTMAYQDADAVDITGGDIVNVNLDLRDMTNEIYLPVGPTYLRTASPINGLMRFNTDGGGFYEGYINGNWQKFTTVNQGSYTISYLLVAGGGGGADIAGVQGSGQGGGGAGGLFATTLTAIPSTTFTVVIGGGGGPQSAGSNTYISGIKTVYGGGAGNGGGGGSGGGGVGSQVGGSATVAGEGNAGGNGSAFWGSGGGGGGASAAGAVGSNYGGAGGAGTANTLTGTTVYYAGGGGGSGAYPDNLPGAGGIGGGGGGGASGSNGGANTGGGGGGQRAGGFNGGSGIAVFSMPTANYSGNVTGLPSVTTSGANTIIRFTQSGTYVA
jgi:hypothetical protein